MADKDLSSQTQFPHYDSLALAAAASTVTLNKGFGEVYAYVDDGTNTGRISTDGGSELCPLPKQTWILIWKKGLGEPVLTFDLDVDAGTPTCYLMCFGANDDQV